ncbi:TPA: hypothetical protein ACH3X1_000007 [Trebouxia sp. C0004]
MLQQTIVSKFKSLKGKSGWFTAQVLASTAVTAFSRKAPEAKKALEGAMLQMYAPDYAAKEWQDWKRDNHQKVDEACSMMEKNFDNKYRLDRGQLVTKVKEHYNVKPKIARGATGE